MAIGWHFFYEGRSKVETTEHPGKPFSAEGYLRGAVGPFAPRFRALIDDPDSLKKLDKAELQASWDAQLKEISGHYAFTDEQAAKAEKSLADTKAKADAWFQDPENIPKLKDYRQKLEKVEEREASPPSLSYEWERLYKARKELESDRKALVATVDAWGQSLRESWLKLATAEQAERSGAVAAPFTQLDWINALTMYGLMAVGLCLILGFLTPLAALLAAGYLLMFYLSQPPWPGLPDNPMAEGHYLYVNKNLIEMLACLVLASTPNGLWIGLDALLFGWIGRRRAQPAASLSEPRAAAAR
jgi:uncharacterized membrane protein YphA (DoxX/SURF4 family)